MFLLLCILKQVVTIQLGTDLVNNFDEYVRQQNPITRDKDKNNLNNVTFPILENYEVNATPVTETKYPWIGRIVHSQSNEVPHICTAICIDPAIFITAARCLYMLKVNYTTIIYNKQKLPALALVVPYQKSKQVFDDIGFIVVDSKSTWKDRSKWRVIELLNTANRTSLDYSWFIKLNYTAKVKVLGYAAKKGIHRLVSVDRHYNLTELDVIASNDICHDIIMGNQAQRIFVPCYYACTYKQFIKKDVLCNNYHGVEGGAVFDSISNKLMGVATWGIYYSGVELPVGFSFANSKKFFVNYACAKKIRADNRQQIYEGYYQRLCK